MTTIIEIAVPAPLYDNFDYLPSATETTPPQIGARVAVPFGRRSLIGIVVGQKKSSKIKNNKLRRIHHTIDTHVFFNTKNIELATWIANYYHHPLGEVLNLMLPQRMRQGLDGPGFYFEITEAGKQFCQQQARAKKQLQLCQKVNADGKTEPQQLRDAGFSTSTINNCIKNNYIKKTAAQNRICQTINPELAETPIKVNHEQQIAIDAVNKCEQFQCFLLSGVTGSGKTEVYLQAIETCLKRNLQALVLIPEISLTAQTIARFTQRFKTKVACLHSKLNATERSNAWQQAAFAQAGILIGTRSALFAPMPRLGIIIVDEEHDQSYKQQSKLLYHARDVAIYRAKQNNIPILLGSATPSLESWHNVKKGKYNLLELKNRANKTPLPSIEIIDMQKQANKYELISSELKQIIKNTISKNQQILIFLNRRGWAPVYMCHGCGWRATCNKCSADLVLHKNPNVLRCHRCDFRCKLETDCSSCNQNQIKPLGVGTQQLEEYLQTSFDVNVLRIDRDSTRRRGQLDNMLQLARDNQAQILVGTQMLAKGHHIPNITKVIILNADCGLFSTDFHANENLAQLIHQVAGRSGRGEEQGKVYIQSLHKDHPLWDKICNAPYAEIADQMLAEREASSLPPVTFQALLCCEDKSAQIAEQKLTQIKTELSKLNCHNVSIYGPIPAPIERINAKYRAQLWLQSKHRIHIQKLIAQLINTSAPQLNKVSIDIDPKQSL